MGPKQAMWKGPSNAGAHGGPRVQFLATLVALMLPASGFAANIQWGDIETLSSSETSADASFGAFFGSSKLTTSNGRTLAVSADGSKLLVVWRQEAAADIGDLYSRYWTTGGGWGQVTQITTASGNEASPAVAYSSWDGKFHMAYETDENSVDVQEVAYRSWNGSAWSTIEFVSDSTDVIPGSSAKRRGEAPWIEVDAAGNVFVQYRLDGCCQNEANCTSPPQPAGCGGDAGTLFIKVRSAGTGAFVPIDTRVSTSSYDYFWDTSEEVTPANAEGWWVKSRAVGPRPHSFIIEGQRIFSVFKDDPYTGEFAAYNCSSFEIAYPCTMYTASTPERDQIFYKTGEYTIESDSVGVDWWDAGWEAEAYEGTDVRLSPRWLEWDPGAFGVEDDLSDLPAQRVERFQRSCRSARIPA